MQCSFLEAKEALLKAGLIDRSSEDATLAVHRLVQAAVMKRLSPPERLRYFNRVVKLLSNGFPNTWNTVTSHQFSSWAKCERCLPHVNFLIVQSNRYKLIPTNPAEFTELILRCCWQVTPPPHKILQVPGLLFSLGICTSGSITTRPGSLCKPHYDSSIMIPSCLRAPACSKGSSNSIPTTFKRHWVYF